MSDVTIKKYTDIPVAEFVEGDTVLTVGSDNKLKRVESTPGGGGKIQNIFIPLYNYDWDDTGYDREIKNVYPPFMTDATYQYFLTIDDCVARTNGLSLSSLIPTTNTSDVPFENYVLYGIPFEATNSPKDETDLTYEDWSATFNNPSVIILVYANSYCQYFPIGISGAPFELPAIMVNGEFWGNDYSFAVNWYSSDFIEQYIKGENNNDGE